MTSDKRTFHVHPNLETTQETPEEEDATGEHVSPTDFEPQWRVDDVEVPPLGTLRRPSVRGEPLTRDPSTGTYRRTVPANINPQFYYTSPSPREEE